MDVTRLRTRLGAAACLLVAAGARTASGQVPSSDAPDTTMLREAVEAPASPYRWQFDGAALLYGEKGRTKVIEPQARITRLYPSGQTISATLGFDLITGASPTGAIPSASVQTTTSPSGNVSTTTANDIPKHPFNDKRAALDLEWSRPLWSRLTPSFGTHASIEQDYRSLGGSGKLSLAMMHNLTTLSLGGGYSEDRVDPVGGTKLPLSDGSTLISRDPNAKRVRSATVGVSRILTRRWLFGLNGTRSTERGYLTDPYKVISVLDSTDTPVSVLTESRPTLRTRRDLLASSVYHFNRNILYASLRHYWDDWGVKSNTADARYRIAISDERWLMPHARYYFQTRANFYQPGLHQGDPLPAFATSDQRLGDLRTFTLGLTYGFHPHAGPGEVTVRAEYLHQWGKRSKNATNGGDGELEDGGGAPVAPGPIDYIPGEDIGSVLVGYSVPF